MTLHKQIAACCLICLACLAAAGRTTVAQAPDAAVAAALAQATKPIADRLGDADLQVRLAAARQLGRLGPAARSAAGPLLRAMKEQAVRPEAVKALTRIGPAAMSDLIAALDDDDPFYRVAVLGAIWAVLADSPADAALLGKLGPQLLPDGPRELRIAAAEVVWRVVSNRPADLGPADRAATTDLVARLIENFAKPERGTQTTMAQALATIGRPALPALLAAMKDSRPAVRLGAAEAIGLVGPDARPAVPVLVEWLKSDSWRLRQAAAGALAQMGEAAEPAVGLLIQIAWKTAPPEPKDDAEGIEALGPLLAHQAAERALIRLGPPAAPALPLLAAALANTDASRRLAAIETVAAIGPAAAPTAPRLFALLATWKDPKAPMPATVVAALAKIGPSTIAPASELLAGKDETLRIAATDILRLMGEQASPAVPALIAALKSSEKSPAVRTAVVEALAAIGPAAADSVGLLASMVRTETDTDLRGKMFAALSAAGPAAVQPLTGLLVDPDLAVRREAVGAIGWIGSAAAHAAPAVPASQMTAAVAMLLERLDDEDASIRLVAPLALSRVGEPAIKPLLDATRWEEANEQAGAIESLGRIGPITGQTPGVVRRLLALAADSDSQVRSAAVWAIGQLGSKPLADPAVRQMLADRLADPAETVAVRSAAATSLGNVPNPTAAMVQSLAGLLADRALADAATDGLRAMGTTVFAPPRKAK